MLFDGIGQETGGAEVDDDRARVHRAKMLGENSILESPNGIGVRALKSIGTFGHRFVENGEHFCRSLIGKMRKLKHRSVSFVNAGEFETTGYGKSFAIGGRGPGDT